MSPIHDHPVPEQLAAAGAPLADEAIGAALAGCTTCEAVVLTELTRAPHVPQVAALVVAWAKACMSVLAMATNTHGQRTLLLWRNTQAHVEGNDAESVRVTAALKILEPASPMPADGKAPDPTWDVTEVRTLLEGMGAAGRSQVCRDALTGVAGSAMFFGV